MLITSARPCEREGKDLPVDAPTIARSADANFPNARRKNSAAAPVIRKAKRDPSTATRALAPQMQPGRRGPRSRGEEKNARVCAQDDSRAGGKCCFPRKRRRDDIFGAGRPRFDRVRPTTNRAQRIQERVPRSRSVRSHLIPLATPRSSVISREVLVGRGLRTREPLEMETRSSWPGSMLNCCRTALGIRISKRADTFTRCILTPFLYIVLQVNHR